MDPNNRVPEDNGHDRERDGGQGDVGGHPSRPAQLPAGKTAPPIRTVRIVTGEYLLTVNPVDGSEIVLCPPGEHPGRPERRSPEERAAPHRTAGPAVAAGAGGVQLPLLEREEERQQLVRLLSRGRSARLIGLSGSGRTALLDAVAAECADLAPDGVIRLSGYHRTPADLLYELFAAAHNAPHYRPGRAELLEAVGEIGAVVVVDDIEFGGSALDELLDATPECAFLISATPDVPRPSAGSRLEEVLLPGLSRTGCVELLERAVLRSLSEEETEWAGDLWFESEGLPLRFVQAAALLRQRDALRAESEAFDDEGVFSGQSCEASLDADGEDVPLPSLAEVAAPANLLASQLGAVAQETIDFAVALGGECPHRSHLPALIGDTHADAAVGELLECGLLTSVAGHHRLPAGATAQLEAAGYGDDAGECAMTAGRHYAWWAGHPSVTPERAAAEADAILATMAVLVAEDDTEQAEVAVTLARTVAPVFATMLHWSAWERALRHGQEAARLTGEVAEEAYFHHELGVLALCTGNLGRARAELEASVALRGALADRRGVLAGRRALALIEDKVRESVPAIGRTAARDDTPEAPTQHLPALPAGATTKLTRPDTDANTVLITARAGASGDTGAKKPSGVQRTLSAARRNMFAVGAGTVLTVVLGTVVTLGMLPSDEAADRVKTEQSTSDDDGNGYLVDAPPSPSTSKSPQKTEAGETSPGPGTFGPAASDFPVGAPPKSGKPSSSRTPGGSGGQNETSQPTASPKEPPPNSSTTPNCTPSGPSGSPSPSQSSTGGTCDTVDGAAALGGLTDGSTVTG